MSSQAPSSTRQSSRSAPTPAGTGNHGPLAAARGKLQQLLAVASLLVIGLVFFIASPNFLTYNNVTNILFSTVVIGMLAVGTTFVIITGGVDLSIGTGMALSAVVAGTLITNVGLPVPIGVLAAVLFGGLIGLVNGLNVAVLGLPPFIATLAMMLAAEGLALIISRSAPVYIDSSSYTAISTGNLVPGVDFPNGVVILVVVALIAAVVLNRTVFGRYTYAIGSNEEATALSGIAVRRWKIGIYAFAGLFTGLAGVLISARLGSAQPSIGMGYELQAIAAVVIGGTSLTGGRGTIVGSLIGALIISTLNNGLQILSIPQEWQSVILGAVIVFAVYTDMARRKNSA